MKTNCGSKIARLTEISARLSVEFLFPITCGIISSITIRLTDSLQIGDRVLAVTDYKAWAEQVAVSEQFVYKMPTSMTFEEGAAFFMNYVTAYILLFDIGNLRMGQSVLVHSAGGGVVCT